MGSEREARRADLAAGGAEGSAEVTEKGRLWLGDGSCIRLRPERPNQVWSYDFVESRTHDGRKFRMLNVVDEFTRECLAIRIDRKLNSTAVVDVLTDLFILRGCQAMFGQIMAWNLSPKPSGTGSMPSVRKRLSSSPAAHGRTVTARASIRSCATSYWTARYSTRSPRHVS